MRARASITSWALLAVALGAVACDAPAPTADSVAGVQSAVVRPTVTRRLAVVLLHYGEPLIFDPDFYRSVLFDGPDSVRNFYLDATHGALTFQGDVFDWIPTQRAEVCDDRNQIAINGVAAAAAANIDLSSYQHVAFVLADTCTNGGSADIGTPANPGRFSVYYAATAESLFAHELGHNLGMAHVLGYDCGAASMGAPAACAESLDSFFELMGRGYVHFNAYNQALQGWLDGCNLVTVPGTGEFTLAPLELGTNDLQAVRVPVPNSLCSPQTGQPCFYYVEYRQRIGWDAKVGNSDMFQGALIHLGGELNRNAIGHPSHLLDMHPPAPGQGLNFFDSALRVGETFTDPSGIQISVLSETAQRLRVRVQVAGGTGPATCLGSPVTATFNLSSQSATQYCGDIMVRNNGSTVVSNWQVGVDLRQSMLLSNWNSVFTLRSGSIYTVTPPPWNAFIQPGQTVAAGMCAQKTGPNFLPLILSATGS